MAGARGGRADSIAESGGPEQKSLLLEYYKEAGHLFRHYSKLRSRIVMTGLTVVITALAYTYINIDEPWKFSLVCASAWILFCSFVFFGAFFGVKCEQSLKYQLLFEELRASNDGPYTVIPGSMKSGLKYFDMTTGIIFFLGSVIQAAAYGVRLYNLL